MTGKRDDPKANEMTPPLPTAQDAGQAPLDPNVQTRPPEVQPPLTSSTGTGFNAPDAGAAPVDRAGKQHDARDVSQDRAATPPDGPQPKPGNIDRDALAGEKAGAGSQAGAEAVSSASSVT